MILVPFQVSLFQRYIPCVSVLILGSASWHNVAFRSNKLSGDFFWGLVCVLSFRFCRWLSCCGCYIDHKPIAGVVFLHAKDTDS